MFKALFSFIMYHISSTYVLCPNPSLGCLPPKSNRRQCSRLCSVLWCIIFLQHVLCPNPTLGCLPPKSDRRQCSRLCSVLLCMSVLSHASPFVAQNISPPTQYAVSFIGSPFWRQTCYPPLPEYMLSETGQTKLFQPAYSLFFVPQNCNHFRCCEIIKVKQNIFIRSISEFR